MMETEKEGSKKKVEYYCNAMTWSEALLGLHSAGRHEPAAVVARAERLEC